MRINNRIAAFHDDMMAWRRQIHAHPETAFEERRTADLVAQQLGDFGVEVQRGLAVTGVVGTLRSGEGPAIGLRADMDALDLDEANDFDHCSREQGKMHACGHDGHTAMLLGAARHLAETGNFRGTIHFIFQPAEELAGGGKRMIDEGLFEQFPVDAVYGMHNWPGMAVGEFAACVGPTMAASDTFEIKVRGRGGHAGWPHLGSDPVVAASAIVMALQSIVSRNVNPAEAAVVSVTQVHGGAAWNVIPEEMVIRGTSRSLSGEVRDAMEAALRRLVAQVASGFDTAVEVDYRRGYPPLVNHAVETELAANAAADLVGVDKVARALPPSMGAEDFAYMLQERPGCYVWIGNGESSPGAGLHGPRYDFNDEILPLGASYWVRLAETALPA